jgi:hypothetical protein
MFFIFIFCAIFFMLLSLYVAAAAAATAAPKLFCFSSLHIVIFAAHKNIYRAFLLCKKNNFLSASILSPFMHLLHHLPLCPEQDERAKTKMNRKNNLAI